MSNLPDFKVTGFISVKPIRKFFKCIQCEAEVEMPAKVPKFVTDSAGERWLVLQTTRQRVGEKML